MARDFTLQTYRDLLRTYLEQGYRPLPFERYFKGEGGGGRTLLLRHDVDRAPERALEMARVEHEAGASGTYYFRKLAVSFKPRIIRAIAEMGHEIGYHYEDLALKKGRMEAAIDSFRDGLDRLRQYYPVRTVCMHGSPLSRYDNRKLLERIDLDAEGILGEPYLNIDPYAFLYLTDTGGRWDGGKSSVRDLSGGAAFGIRSSFGLMEAIRNDALPEGVHQTVHPQRWMDEALPWYWERGAQKVKNVLKRGLKKLR